MKVNQIKFGIILSYGSMALSILIGLIYTPVMLRLLGQSEYGLYNTVSSTISTLNLLNLGFGATYIRYYSKYKNSDDWNAINRLNGLFLIVFSVIGLIALLCGLFLTNNLNVVFDEGFTSAEYEKARVLFFLMTLNLALGFPMSVFSSIINAHEKFVFQKLVGIITSVVSPLVTLPLLLMGYGSVGMVAVSIVLHLITWVINLYYCFVKLKVKVSFRNLEFSVFRGMFAYSFFIAINMIIDQINWNVDKMLLGRFQGTMAVAVYSVGFSLYSYYQMLSTSISNVFTPRIHNIVNKPNQTIDNLKNSLTETFVRVGRLQFLILGLLASGVVFFSKDLILNIWAGEGYDDSYYVAVLLILPSTIALIQNLGIEIQRAQNKHQFRSVVYFFMALMNLAVSVVLCQKYGAIGSAIGTALSLIIANGFIMNIYYQKKCNVNVIVFWKNIFRMSIGLIVPCIAGFVINKFVPYTNVFVFGLKILAFVIVYASSMWLLAMNDYEKNLVKKPISKVVNKLRNR